MLLRQYCHSDAFGPSKHGEFYVPPGSIIKSRKGRKNNTNWIFIMCQGSFWDLSHMLLICIIDTVVCVPKPVVLQSVSTSQGLVSVEFSLIKYLPPSSPLILPLNLGDPPVHLVCLAFTTAILPAFLFCSDSHLSTVNPWFQPHMQASSEWNASVPSDDDTDVAERTNLW